MALSLVQHRVLSGSRSLHAVQHAAHMGCVVRPFVQAQPCVRTAIPPRRRPVVLPASSQTMEIVLKADEGDQPLKATWSVEEGLELHSMPFSKPLGAVLAEQKGRIVVEKILDGSNAALGGLQPGDVIRGTTGRSKVDAKATRAGSGSRAKQDYWGAQVLVNADGQAFDTVMAAINSSRCETCDVTLVVERRKEGKNKANPQSPAGNADKQ